MTQLICLVQRLYLGDEKRTLIKEGERFDVDAKTAEIYITGGIAAQAPAELPAPVEVPEPVPEPVPGPVPEPVQDEPRRPSPKGDRKKGR